MVRGRACACAHVCVRLVIDVRHSQKLGGSDYDKYA